MYTFDEVSCARACSCEHEVLRHNPKITSIKILCGLSRIPPSLIKPKHDQKTITNNRILYIMALKTYVNSS